MSVTTDVKVTVSGSSDTLIDGYTFVSGEWQVTITASEGDDTADFVASLPVHATIDASEGDDVAAFVAALPTTVTIDATEADDVAAFGAAIHTMVTFAASEADDTAHAYALNDWTNTIPPAAQIYYRAELRHAGGTVKLPISSWQATIQIDRASFLQAVVPAAENYIDDIIEAGLDSEFAIVRGVRVGDEDRELDMASVPLGQMPYQRGPQRSTVTLSGYGAIAFEAIDGESPPSGTVRSLAEVQTLSTQGGTRVRAGIDWLLRPGLIAEADGVQFNVSYINYYVNAANAFMDVGERPQ